MPQPLLAYLLRKFWSVLVVLTVSAAVIVSFTRIMLPRLGDYRLEIQHWVSQSLGQPVQIEALNADWKGWTPNLHLKDISLLDRKRNRVITRFKELTISLDIFASLYNLQFIPDHLVLSGIDLSLVRKPDGTVTIEGVSTEQENATSLEKNALAYWLEQQSELLIQSARVTWNDEALGRTPLTFDRVSLRLQNRGNHHRFTGSADLPEGRGQTVSFILDARGDLLTRGWAGQLYVDGKGLKLEKLLAHSGFHLPEAPDGAFNFKLWSEWKHARLLDFTTRFEASHLQFASPEQQLEIESASGEFYAERIEKQGWRIHGRNLKLLTRNGTWPETRFDLLIRKENLNDPNQSISAALDFMRVEDLWPVLASLDLFSPRITHYLDKTQPRGDLSKLIFSYEPARPEHERYIFSSSFKDLRSSSFEAIPGVNGFDGQMKIRPQSGSLQITSEALQVQMPKVFHRPLWLDRLDGTLVWDKQDDHWQLHLPALTLSNSDLEASLAGDISFEGGVRPRVDLRANFLRGDVSRTGDYLPYPILPPKTQQWLETALTGGEVVGGGMVLRGDLNHFPFDDHSGRFEVLVQVEDGLLDYAEDWPRIEELEAEVIFSGRSMDIHAIAGKIYDADILNATARIASLGHSPELLVSGSLRGDVLSGYEFISNSPLKESIGKRLDRIGLTNEIGVDLQLRIPLGGEDHTVSTSGTIHFEDNVATQPEFNVTLEQVKGTYTFSADGRADADLHAIYHGTPVTLVLKDQPRERTTIIDLRGRATPEFIRDRLSEAAPGAGVWLESSGLYAVLKGNTRWHARMELPVDEEDPARPASLQIKADLKGMQIDAPAPLGKATADRFPFSIKTPLGDDRDKLIEFSYSDILRGSFQLKPGTDGLDLTRTEIHIGQSRAPSDYTDALWIGGHLSELDISHWIDFYRQQTTTEQTSASTFPSTLIDLSVDRLSGYGQQFSDTEIHARNTAGEWHVNLDGQEARGRIQIPADLNNGIVKLDFDHLLLGNDPQEQTDQVSTLDPRRFPAVVLNISDLKYAEQALGQLELRSSSIADGVSIDEMHISNEHFNLDANGQWLLENQQQHSRFNIELAAPKLEGLLTHFGYEGTAIEDAETHIDLDADWPGSLTDFALEKMNGKLRLDINQGRLVDVNASAGKIFGLLSLQGLKRRLTLDFNDLFKKGFSFDSLIGSFIIENGHAYTNDLLISGPSATISINGRTGLIDQDYDQLVTVTPAVASSLPVASALFGPVGVGVGAVVLLAEKVFKKLPDTIDKVLTRQYSVTGSWDEPEVSRYKDITASDDQSR